MEHHTYLLYKLQVTNYCFKLIKKMIVMRGKEQMDRGMVKEIPESLVR